MPLAQGKLVASTLGKILSGVLSAAPDAPLSSLDCMSHANFERIREWNDSYHIPPIERCIHDVIADRIAEQPDAEAVCAWDGSFTYRELDIAADRLAVKLVGLGVGPETFVPHCFEKSVRAAVCVNHPVLSGVLTRLTEVDTGRGARHTEGRRSFRAPGSVSPR